MGMEDRRHRTALLILMSAVWIMPLILIFGFSVLTNGQKAILINANAREMVDTNEPPAVVHSNFGHSHAYTFKNYVLMYGQDAFGHLKNEESGPIQKPKLKDPVMAETIPKRTLGPSSAKETRLRRKREAAAKAEEGGCKSKFARCNPVFPINWKEEGVKQIGPFPVPWFPLDEKCAATKPANLPASKLTISYRLVGGNNNIKCSKWLIICYAPAFEGVTKEDFWELLKLNNIEGNFVAKECNKNVDIPGMKWHGFGIFRKVKEENITQRINDINVDKRFIISDIMYFSYSKRGVILKEGEFFDQIILIEDGIDVMTSRRNIFQVSFGPISDIDSLPVTYYDPEGRSNLEKRPDLMSVDLSAVQKIFYQFKYNASLWTVPYDLAFLEPSKYAVPVEGIPDGKKMTILAMKAIHPNKCFMEPAIDIDDCVYEWKKVAPIIYKYISLNGTTVTAYQTKYGYLKHAKTIFKKYEWDQIAVEVKKFKEAYDYIKKGFNDFTMSNWDVKIGELEYAKITGEEYANGLMTIKLTCLGTEVAYGWAKFDSRLTANRTEPTFDWTNEFDYFTGCNHSLINLLSTLDESETHKTLVDQPEYKNLQFYVGLTAKVSGLEFTQQQSKNLFKIFHVQIQKEEFNGQKVLMDERLMKVFMGFNLNAKFRRLKADFLATFMKLDSSNAWATIIGEYGLFQEIYECPKFRVYLPQISGQIKFTFENVQGEINTDFFGYSSKNPRINFIDSYEISTQMGKLKCRLNNVYKHAGLKLYNYADQNARDCDL